MPKIKMNDIEMYYELQGKGHHLILISGYACDHTYWNMMMNELVNKFQVLIFDNRSVGQTKDNGLPFKLENMAEDVIELIQQLGLKQPHILGHSMGAAIAQIIGKKYHDQINKIILLNSTAKHNIRSMKALESILNLRKNNVAFDLLLENSMPWFFSSDYLANPENILSFKTSIMNNPYFQSIQDQERQLNAILEFDSRKWLNLIKVETLIIGALDDILNLPVESQQLRDKISQAELKLVSGGHSSPIEQPNEMCQLIFNFLG
jgi:pimeloyl-ACP methyl ester carboxylesterase